MEDSDIFYAIAHLDDALDLLDASSSDFIAEIYLAVFSVRDRLQSFINNSNNGLHEC